MTAQGEPYVRVYYSIIDDPRFAEVYPNDRNLATWLRLLLGADAMYPAPAALPRSVSSRALHALAQEAGLVERIGRDHYRMHGLKGERDKRSAAARAAGAKRAQEAVRDASGRWTTAPADAGGGAGPSNQLSAPSNSEPSHSDARARASWTNGGEDRPTIADTPAFTRPRKRPAPPSPDPCPAGATHIMVERTGSAGAWCATCNPAGDPDRRRAVSEPADE